MTLLDLMPAGVVVPGPVESVLSALTVNAAGTSATVSAATGVPVLLGTVLRAGATVPVTITGAPFRIDLTLSGLTLDAPAGVVGATRTATGAGSLARVRYSASGSPLAFAVTGAIRITVDAANRARLTAIPGLTIRPNSREMLLPSGFGLRLPSEISPDADHVVLTDVEFALPAGIPLLGGLALNASLSVGADGVDVATTATALAGGPDVAGTLRWKLPPGASLNELSPTGIDIGLTLPSSTGSLPQTPVAGGPPINRRVVFRLCLSRLPGDPSSLSTTVSAESQAPEGLLSSPEPPTTGDIAAGVATAFAPAIAAATGSPTAAGMAALFSAAAALSNYVAAGGFTIHSVTLDAGTRISDTSTGGLRVSLDISGAVAVKPLGITPITITMDPKRPLRVRWRNIRATLAAGSSVPALDFSNAKPEVVDPGGWNVNSPGSLLDIVGTRSGSGSTWIEVDLRFSLDLGPVKISGATVRATFDSGGLPDIGLRGLDASIEVPGLLTGSGKVALNTDPADAGIDLVLAATIVPINVGALAAFSTSESGGVRRVQFAFGVDLPGPIPLGPTGLGLYGVLGAFGANAALPPLGDDDPLRELRKWKPWDRLDTSAGNMTIGAGLIIGTAIDNGFVLNARGVLGVTAPDLALRAGLDGQVFHPCYKWADIKSVNGADDPPGLTFFGGVSATAKAIDVGLLGSYRIPYVVDVKLPVAAHFPNEDPDTWWFRAGSDDGVNGFHPQPARPPGPMRASVFPGTPFSAGGWAFLMVHGDGISNLLGTNKNFPGFTVAAGAGFSKVFGVRHVLWADIHASLAAAISAKPLMLWASVGVGGEFGIGPFSIGVDANLQLQVGPQDRLGYKLEVCGSIDLWLDTLRGCIRLNNLGDQGQIPEPGDDEWPFPSVSLADGLGRSLTTPADLTDGVNRKDRPLEGGETLTANQWKSTPKVWPDTVPLLTFPIAPYCEPGTPQPAATQNTGIVSSGQIAYRWRLFGIRLDEVADDGTVTPQSINPTAWQQPPTVPVATAATSTQRQLALLTGNHGISTAHLADGGKLFLTGHKPAEYVGGLCAWSPVQTRGWSLGEDATATGPRSWHAPREHETFGIPTVFASFGRGTGFAVTSTRHPDETYNPGLAHAPGPFGFTPDVEVGGRDFDGALRLPSARWTPRPSEFEGISPGGVVTHRVSFDDAVADGDFYIMVASSCSVPDRFAQRNIRVETTRVDNSVERVDAEVELDDPLVLRVPLAPDVGNPVVALTIFCPWILSLSILGLHALTAADTQAAKNAADATKAAVPIQASGSRTVLKPGSRYRLAVELGWSRLASPDGSVTAADAPQNWTRYWFFRTAAAETGTVSGAGGAGAGAATGAAGWKGAAVMPDVAQLLAGVDRFRPDYLGRYLGSYSPGDHTQFFFTDDRPKAQFTASHVRELAKAFGRDIGLLLHRTDRTAADGGVSKYRADIAKLSFDPVRPFDVLVAATATEKGCKPPPTGLVLEWPEGLQKNAHYELSVAVPPNGQTPVKGTPELDGIAFATSSFANPRELVESFGFVDPATGQVPSAHACGDLLVQSISRPAGLVVDDAEFEALANDLGLPPLRPTDANRSSVLWVQDGDVWSILGLLLESTEPLLRAGGDRMNVQQARLGGTVLAVRRLNRSGTLAAWLATHPIRSTTAAELTLRFTDKTTPYDRAVTVQPSPRFAQGALAAGGQL